MHKLLGVLIIMVVVPHFVAGQNQSVFQSENLTYWAVGIKTGLGMNMALGDLGKTGTKPSLKGMVGGYGEYSFNKYMAIYSALMVGINTGFTRDNYSLHWTTLDFDIIFKGRLPVNAWYTATLGIGYTVSTGMGSLREVSGGVKRNINFADYSLNAVLQGIVVEIGNEFTLPVGYITVALRTDWRFVPLFKQVPYTDYDLRTGSVHLPFGLMLSYGFKF
jgi:hypothetical protein